MGEGGECVWGGGGGLNISFGAEVPTKGGSTAR